VRTRPSLGFPALTRTFTRATGSTPRPDKIVGDIMDVCDYAGIEMGRA
jgi:hypothetical protein